MSKLIASAVIAGLLFGVAAPAFAGDDHKDKASCEKDGMKWDEATKTCSK